MRLKAGVMKTVLPKLTNDVDFFPGVPLRWGLGSMLHPEAGSNGMSGVSSNAYAGALLWDVLNLAPVGGIITNPSVKNDILHKIIIVTGTDCYKALFGAGEVDPSFGDSQIMLAYAANGQLLGSEDFARLIAPGDKAGGRFVFNIATIEIKDAGK
jgi:hypothetical protein